MDAPEGVAYMPIPARPFRTDASTEMSARPGYPRRACGRPDLEHPVHSDCLAPLCDSHERRPVLRAPPLPLEHPVGMRRAELVERHPECDRLRPRLPERDSASFFERIVWL